MRLGIVKYGGAWRGMVRKFIENVDWTWLIMLWLGWLVSRWFQRIQKGDTRVEKPRTENNMRWKHKTFPRKKFAWRPIVCEQCGDIVWLEDMCEKYMCTTARYTCRVCMVQDALGVQIPASLGEYTSVNASSASPSSTIFFGNRDV